MLRRLRQLNAPPAKAALPRNLLRLCFVTNYPFLSQAASRGIARGWICRYNRISQNVTFAEIWRNRAPPIPATPKLGLVNVSVGVVFHDSLNGSNASTLKITERVSPNGKVLNRDRAVEVTFGPIKSFRGAEPN